MAAPQEPGMKMKVLKNCFNMGPLRCRGLLFESRFIGNKEDFIGRDFDADCIFNDWLICHRMEMRFLFSVLALLSPFGPSSSLCLSPRFHRSLKKEPKLGTEQGEVGLQGSQLVPWKRTGHGTKIKRGREKRAESRKNGKWEADRWGG